MSKLSSCSYAVAFCVYRCGVVYFCRPVVLGLTNIRRERSCEFQLFVFNRLAVSRVLFITISKVLLKSVGVISSGCLAFVSVMCTFQQWANGRGTDRHIVAVDSVNCCTVGNDCNNPMTTRVNDGLIIGSARIVGLTSGRRDEASIYVTSCKTEWYGAGI